MKNKATKLYLVCLHILVVIILIKSDFIEKVEDRFGLEAPQEEINDQYRTMAIFQARVGKNLPSNAVLFIGDSHIQGLAVSAITAHAVNYGIGNDTTVGVMARLPGEKLLTRSRAVVLAIGFNDLRYRDNRAIIANIVKILQRIPETTKVVLCAIFPVGKMVSVNSDYNERIVGINASMQRLPSRYANVTYLSIFDDLTSDGILKPEYHLNDGIHLSPKGYDVWINQLTFELNKLKGQ